MTAPSPFPTYHARAGEALRCLGGHKLGVFAEPFIVGEAFDADRHIRSWTLDRDNQLSGVCSCGYSWRRGSGSSVQVRVGSDWVPPLAAADPAAPGVSLWSGMMDGWLGLQG